MARPPLPAAVRIEIAPPALLRSTAMLAISAYGLLLATPVLLAMLVVSVRPFGLQTFVLPLATIAAATYFLPFGFGNPHIGKLVRSVEPAARTSEAGFVVQLSTIPRTRSGLRALLEDADDIGWLSLTDTELTFRGDSIKLTLPFEQIREVKPQSIGWRGFFLYSPRLALMISGIPNLEALEFTERSSWTLPGSRKIAQQLFQRILHARTGSQL